MTIAESIERHIRLANAAVEWKIARDRLRGFGEWASGREVETARRDVERCEVQLETTVSELQQSITVTDILDGPAFATAAARSQR